MRTHSVWVKEEQQRREREARIFIAGFWAGLAPGMAVAIVCVIVALWLRG